MLATKKRNFLFAFNFKKCAKEIFDFESGVMNATLKQVLQGNVAECREKILVDLYRQQLEKNCTRQNEKSARRNLSDFDDVYTILANR